MYWFGGLDLMHLWRTGAFCCGKNGSFSGVILPVWLWTTWGFQ